MQPNLISLYFKIKNDRCLQNKEVFSRSGINTSMHIVYLLLQLPFPFLNSKVMII